MYLRNNMLVSKFSGKRKYVDRLRWRITLIAFFSRCCQLILQALFNALIPDHYNEDIFITPAMNTSKTTDDNLVFQIFGGLSRWDGQHFLQISVYGYVYEHSLAFFPIFPMTIQFFGLISRPILSFLNTFHHHLVISTFFNMLCFVWSATVLFNLSYKELRDEKLAYLSAIFFCINPASIFFSAVYSESLFSLLSFSVMLCDNLIPCCLLVALSAGTRSNGIFNIGYPWYKLLVRYMDDRKTCFTTTVFLFRVLSVFAMSMTVFVLFQIYGYREFCGTFPSFFESEILNLVGYEDLVLRGTGSEGMCNSTVPYFYVQKRYWKVGLLSYFYWKQWPNFLIALPIMSYCSFKTYQYLYPKRKALFNHGLKAISTFKSDSRIFPYVVHLSALLVLCFFFVHIQVSTRLLCSSSPLVYWYFAKSVEAEMRHKIECSVKDVVTLLVSRSRVVYYCLVYNLVGVLLFSNFFPWT